MKKSLAEETLDLHKRESLSYFEYFPVLVFEGILSIETALWWLVKDTIMWLMLVLIVIFISVSTLPILDPWQRTYYTRWTQENLGSPFSIDPQAYYPRWVLTGHNLNSTYIVFVLYFHYPRLFYPWYLIIQALI